MVNQIVNALIAGVVGAVAFIAVRALVIGAGEASCGNALTCNTSSGVVAGDCGTVLCQNGTANATHCSGTYGAGVAINSTCDSGIECWMSAECTMFLTIIPLAIAIMTIVALFIGLTKVRGV